LTTTSKLLFFLLSYKLQVKLSASIIVVALVTIIDQPFTMTSARYIGSRRRTQGADNSLVLPQHY
jgi:hypothetical protein